MNENQPVTRLELIDAIAKLHVINDASASFSPILNNSSRFKRNRCTETGQTPEVIELSPPSNRLDENTKTSNTEE
jgi:hypothetical protein